MQDYQSHVSQFQKKEARTSHEPSFYSYAYPGLSVSMTILCPLLKAPQGCCHSCRFQSSCHLGRGRIADQRDWPFRLCLLASVNDNDRTMKNKTKREAGAERLYGGAKSVKRIKEMKEYSGWG
ncbi:hypothetical protein HKD37_13G037028 [Glycine soja]